MDQDKYFDIKVNSSYFNETGDRVEMQINSFRFYPNNTILMLGNDKYGSFEIKGSTQMTKLILEKKYLNSETKLFLGGYIYGDRIKFIWDSQDNYADIFSNINENFFHGEIKLNLTIYCHNDSGVKLYLNSSEIYDDIQLGLILKNYIYHFIELEKDESKDDIGNSCYSTKIYQPDGEQYDTTKTSFNKNELFYF